ncbi:MAG: nitroreductase family protein [Nitriliruptorales bacterium]|nr:nitroreductase family protein [Nitriliruptorales bacterium]
MDEPRFIDLDFDRLSPDEMLDRARALLDRMWSRRSVRTFATEPVDRELIEAALRIASSAPSGAHLQPWTWVVVTDPDLKRRLRAAAEEEERAFYEERAPEEWLEALAPLGTDEVKTHLTDAPYVVVLFRHRYELTEDGRKRRNYYSAESCGIAAGFFIAAVHLMGLATLPHTPSPMGFLSELLERPDNEQAFLVLPVGYPAPGTQVPDIARKPLSDVVVWR